METATRGKERGRSVGKRRWKEASSKKGRVAGTAGVLGGGRGTDAGREWSGGGGPDGDVAGQLATKIAGLPSRIADAVVSDDWEAELQEVTPPISDKRADLQKVSSPITDKGAELQETPLTSDKTEVKQDKPQPRVSHSVKLTRRKQKKTVKTEKPKSTQTILVDEQKKTGKTEKVKSAVAATTKKERLRLQTDPTDENRNMIQAEKVHSEDTRITSKKQTVSPADSVLDRILSPKPKAKSSDRTKISFKLTPIKQEEIKKDISKFNWWSDKDTDKEDRESGSSTEEKSPVDTKQIAKKEQDLESPSSSQVSVKRKEQEDRTQMPPPPLPDTPVSCQGKRKKPKRKATPMPPRTLGFKTHLEDDLEATTRSVSAPSSRMPSRDPSPSLLRRPSEEFQPPFPVSPFSEDYRKECFEDSGSETSSLEHNLSLASQEELEVGRYGDDEEEANSDLHSEDRGPNGGSVRSSSFPPKLLPVFRGDISPAQVQGSSFPLRDPPGLLSEQSTSLQLPARDDGIQSHETAHLPPNMMQKAQELHRQSVHFQHLSQHHYNFAVHLLHRSLMLNDQYLNIVGGSVNSPPPHPLSPAQPGTYGPVFPFPPPPQAEFSPQYPPPVPPHPSVALQGVGQSPGFFRENSSPFGSYDAPAEHHGNHWYSPHSSESAQQGKSTTLLPPGHFQIPPQMWKKAASAEGGVAGKYVIPAYRSGIAKWKVEQDTSDETSSSVTSPPYKRKMVVSWPSLLEVSYVWQVGVKDAGYVDSHCHIDYLFERMSFRESFQAFMSKANFPASFEGCVAVFCDPKSWVPDGFWRRLLQENDNVWGAFGCHPHSAKLYNMVNEQNLLNCLKHEKAIAFGEIGLDNSKDFSPPSIQKEVFIRQLHLAMQVKKPLVLHCRQADDEMFEIMQDLVPRDYIIHRHCFTESFAVAQRWMEEYPNMYLGITALVTFPTTRALQDAVRRIPLDRLLLETDAPYFVPRQIPQGKVACSHPAMAVCVAEKIAELKAIPLSEVLMQVRENTRTVYGI
ncbi:uncharacterized protein LOC118415293 isoform X1 [Branchiostoma floridae]|uniref:Uncharacterized protein LOC118415293 isoform X1 n=1 Tax=Branchiostoma floridae TaxID=7739 RepID=A0A9J7MQM0_BRAFL|nr:uncharacterized protein LOC118415293 isoform X1 [Branchiostoma floridae]